MAVGWNADRASVKALSLRSSYQSKPINTMIKIIKR
jgi:hypothetical protein